MKTKNYWIYSPGKNASKWSLCTNEGIMCIDWDALGNLHKYTSRDHMREAIKKNYHSKGSVCNDSLAVWQFAYEIKIGDIVIAKKGQHKIIGYGIVESDYIFDQQRTSYKHIRKTKWLNIGEWNTIENNAVKTLTKITPYTDYVEELKKLLTLPDDTFSKQKYSKDDFLNEVFLSNNDYDNLKNLLLRKKNLIIQGAPGVGKTFAAKRLAYAIMGEKNENRIMQVQFHQNYSYEDLVMGYKPNEKGGFELKEGNFYRFCKQADTDREHKYFFIIDEINRGNLSKIFGELLMLIENGYRDKPIQIAYKDEKFAVPSNLYIIGMMNTADRSLAMIDYALRRRFSFFEMKPGFTNSIFEEKIESKKDPHLKKLVNAIIDLNNVIEKDDSLGPGFYIGHSYLCNLESQYDLNNIVEYDIIPMLREYWFDNEERFNQEIQKLRNALK